MLSGLDPQHKYTYVIMSKIYRMISKLNIIAENITTIHSSKWLNP